MVSTRRQHLVSKVVLRHFAGDDGQLLRVDLEWGKIAPCHPTACMYEYDFITASATEAENLWKTVEDHLPAVYPAIENGTLDAQPDAIRTIKDCIALHLIRGHTIKFVTDASTKGAVEQMRREIVNDESGRIEAEYYRETGLYLAGREGRQFFANRIMATIEPALSSAQEFSERIKVHFRSVKDWFAPLAVEIATPENKADEFLIGDSPALAMAPGKLVAGPKGGVTLNEASTVLMPLSPRYVVSLARKSARHLLGREHVAQLNELQVLNAVKQVCCHPSSQLLVRGRVQPK